MTTNSINKTKLSHKEWQQQQIKQRNELCDTVILGCFECRYLKELCYIHKTQQQLNETAINYVDNPSVAQALGIKTSRNQPCNTRRTLRPTSQLIFYGFNSIQHTFQAATTSTSKKRTRRVLDNPVINQHIQYTNNDNDKLSIDKQPVKHPIKLYPAFYNNSNNTQEQCHNNIPIDLTQHDDSNIMIDTQQQDAFNMIIDDDDSNELFKSVDILEHDMLKHVPIELPHAIKKVVCIKQSVKHVTCCYVNQRID